jgi:hypothetical protein
VPVSPAPLLFLDVDGPLIPFGATREQLPGGYPTFGDAGANPLITRIDPGLVEWAAGRPFAWVDDEVTEIDRAWVEAHHPGEALLHRVEAWQGLTDADFDVLHAWLGSGPG